MLRLIFGETEEFFIRVISEGTYNRNAKVVLTRDAYEIVMLTLIHVEILTEL